MTNFGCSNCRTFLGIYVKDMHSTFVFTPADGVVTLDGTVPVCPQCATPNPLPGPARLDVKVTEKATAKRSQDVQESMDTEEK